MSEEQERWILTNKKQGKLKYTGHQFVCRICTKPIKIGEPLLPFDITKHISTSGENVVHKSCKEKQN